LENSSTVVEVILPYLAHCCPTFDLGGKFSGWNGDEDDSFGLDSDGLDSDGELEEEEETV
jgi:hypothetical protein